MIIKNALALKKYITELKRILAEVNLPVKNQRLYEIFAQAVGFKSDAALRQALPVYFDASDADDQFQLLVKKYTTTTDREQLLNTYLYDDMISSLEPFPVIANHEQRLNFRINWNTVLISMQN